MNEQPFSSSSSQASPPLSSQPVPPAPIAPPVATPAIPTPVAVSLSKAEAEAAPVAPANPVEEAADAELNATPLEAAIRARNSGAGWFYWIAGLSIVNSLIVHFGGDSSFPLGLGSTLFIDVIARELSTSAAIGTIVHPISIVLDLLIIGFFILCGKQASKGASWAFVVGGIFYIFDLLIMLGVQEWLGVGLHVWALISLFSGYKANQAVRELQKTTVASPWSA